MLFVGAIYDNTMEDWKRARSHVVDAYGASERVRTFLYLKCLRRAGWCTEGERDDIHAQLQHLMRPAAAKLLLEHEHAALFTQHSKPVACFAFPRYVSRSAVAHWWGSMREAWKLVEDFERTSTVPPGTAEPHMSGAQATSSSADARFEYVLFARADIHFSAPIGHACSRALTNLTWFTAVEPPDAMWLLPRWVARYAMRTISAALNRTVAAAAGGAPTDVRCVEPPMALNGLGYSWFPACYWTLRLWSTGLRLSFDPTFRGYTLTKGHGGCSPLSGALELQTVPTTPTFSRAHRYYNGMKLGCAPWGRDSILDPPAVNRSHGIQPRPEDTTIKGDAQAEAVARAARAKAQWCPALHAQHHQ